MSALTPEAQERFESIEASLAVTDAALARIAARQAQTTASHEAMLAREGEMREVVHANAESFAVYAERSDAAMERLQASMEVVLEGVALLSGAFGQVIDHVTERGDST